MTPFVRSTESLTMKRLHDIFQPWVSHAGWEQDNDGFYRVLAQLVAESPDPITPRAIKEGIRMAYETAYGAMHYSGGALYHFEDRGGVILNFLTAPDQPNKNMFVQNEDHDTIVRDYLTVQADFTDMSAEEETR